MSVTCRTLIACSVCCSCRSCSLMVTSLIAQTPLYPPAPAANCQEEEGRSPSVRWSTLRLALEVWKRGGGRQKPGGCNPTPQGERHTDQGHLDVCTLQQYLKALMRAKIDAYLVAWRNDVRYGFR